MSTTAIRLYTVAALILAIYGLSLAVRIQVKPPEVEMPDWSVKELPIKLGNWQGKEATLDPEIAAATGAEVIEDRIYRDQMGNEVTMHSAMFSDPGGGVYHSPMTCYLTHGWRKLGEGEENVPISDDSTIQVKTSTWDFEGHKVLVAYWYQLGNHVLYGRGDLGLVRWSLRGKEKWPALIKVMVQTDITSDVHDAREVALDFTEKYARWLNSPEHKQYFDRW